MAINPLEKIIQLDSYGAIKPGSGWSDFVHTSCDDYGEPAIAGEVLGHRLVSLGADESTMDAAAITFADAVQPPLDVLSRDNFLRGAQAGKTILYTLTNMAEAGLSERGVAQ